MSGNPADSTMDRYLSRIDVWALSLGCIIGWGAFVMPGTTFLPVAGPGGTVLAMAISTAVTLLIGYNYFVLMKRYPGTGGVYAYTKELFGRDHAFLSSWFLCLSYVSLIPQNATILAVICRTLTGDALSWGFHYQVAGTEVYLVEIGIAIAALALIGLFAICMKPFLQGVQTALGIVFVLGVIVIAVMVTPHVCWQDLLDVCGTASGSPLRGVLSIVILAPWAFVGFEVISLETAHFSFPVRRSGKLIGLAILMGGCIYAVMAITAIVAQPEGYAGWQAYVQDLGNLKGVHSIPTFYAVEHTLGNAGVAVIAITAIAAVTTSIIGFYRASARLLMNMAEDRILAHSFNRPSTCFLFLMVLSILVSLFGRTALAWIVNLSSFGAIVGFGYASAAVRRAARREGSTRDRAMGTAGLVLAAAFAAAQLIPGISLIETMGAESYLLLAAWCLLGFAFYWRTMRTGADDGQRNESVTIAALVFLLIFSIVIWYAKRMSAGAVAQDAATAYSVVLLAFILLGLIVMLRIHSQLRKQRMESETEKIRAIENSQAKSRFLFNMSHDIRTPMNAIVGYANLALKEPLSPEVRNYLEKIDLSSQHMLALINDILEMSRIESGKMELSEAPADLRAMLHETQLLFAEQMRQKRIDFRVETGGIRDAYVHCDRKNLNRVLLNLVSNAFKFTPEGGAIVVSIEQEEAENPGFRTYRIGVKDTGIGMSEEFASKMFSAFERERTSTDSGVEGTGLGLAITKSLVDLMGGNIEVKTATGQGTEMIVRLALRTAQREELAATEPGARREAAGVGAGASDGAPAIGASEEGADAGAAATAIDYSAKRLLLVEDNPINREIATMILSQAGFTVETAENGQIAVDLVAGADAGHYDAVLMDIQMPVMDGYTATRAIRALPDSRKSDVPIVAMTANAFKEDKDAAFEAGMQAHISKPIDVDVMMSTLDEVLS